MKTGLPKTSFLINPQVFLISRREQAEQAAQEANAKAAVGGGVSKNNIIYDILFQYWETIKYISINIIVSITVYAI